jgi:phosphoribosyl 1,2-cyclic phosphate phosphodiesterase
MGGSSQSLDRADGLAEDEPMRVTFLGTGTSHGIPMIGCDCAVCRSADPRNKRLRPSILVESGSATVLVDATPDFRTQALREGICNVDAVLVTHTHADHVMGLDDLRAFTERQQRRMPVYASAESVARLGEIFSYACAEVPRWPGLPSFELRAVQANGEFVVSGLSVRALPLVHGAMPVLGFLFGRELAYVTDCNVVPAEVIGRIRGVTVLVVGALRERPHPTHLSVAQALGVARAVGAGLTLLTHICHELDHATAEAALPQNVRVAYDGMKVEVGEGRWRFVED